MQIDFDLIVHFLIDNILAVYTKGTLEYTTVCTPTQVECVVYWRVLKNQVSHSDPD